MPRTAEAQASARCSAAWPPPMHRLPVRAQHVLDRQLEQRLELARSSSTVPESSHDCGHIRTPPSPSPIRRSPGTSARGPGSQNIVSWKRGNARASTPGAAGPAAVVAAEHGAARAAVPLDRGEDDDRPRRHELVDRRPQLVGHQRVDEHRGVGRLVERAADLLGPLGGAARLRVGLVPRVRSGPVVQPGGDLPHRTSFSISRASVASGSSDSPVWTGEVWITVLDGATSQWKRSDCSSWATGPESAVPGGDLRHRVEVGAHLRDVELGGERRQPRLVERDPRREVAPRAAEEDDADVHALAALDPRDDAHDRVLERAAHGTHPRGAARRRMRYST